MRHAIPPERRMLQAPSGHAIVRSIRQELEGVFGERPPALDAVDGEVVIESELTIEEGDTLRGSFVAETDSRWWIALESSEGFRNENPISWRIAVIPDRAPEVSISQPGQNIEVTPRALLDVSVKVRDDYGVVSAQLIFELGSGIRRSVKKKTLFLVRSLESKDAELRRR